MEKWDRLYRLLVLALALAVVAGVAVLLVRLGNTSGVEVLLPTATPTPELKVYVSGAVARPDVYTLVPGDRVEDALAFAGGVLDGADISRLSLAQRVRDGDHIYVPRQGEALPTPTASAADGRIDINTATSAELETLPQIGPVVARAIVSYREEHGAFASVEELMLVKGIGPATLEKLRDRVTVRER
ncbi:MAG: helix-hairpin-helix domain-containing protein [Chloroflexota bacterium]|nr:helix-hairpin-helix domain-containing protein [Chloroflexota bacterium]